MPFKSDKQRRYLYAEKPKVAKKFAMDSAKKGKMTKLRTGGPQDRGQEAKSQEKGFDQSDLSNPYSDASQSKQAAENKAISGSGGNPTTKTTPKTKTTTSDRKFYTPPSQLPTIGPVTWGLNKVLGYAAPKVYDAKKKSKEKFARKEGLYRDFYRMENKPLEVMDPKNKSFMKEAGYGKTKVSITENKDGPKLCPDGTNPPCKVPTVTKKTVTEPLVKKKQIFDDFKSYRKGKMIKKNKGGGVPYGPPPLRGPNPQVPPVKFSRGGGSAIRGLKFTGVK